MIQTPATDAANSARPKVEVRRLDGQLIRRAAEADAQYLVDRCWAEWRCTGRRRHIVLTKMAPLSDLPSGGSADGTRPIRGDYLTKVYGDGQLMGAPRSHREFIY